MSLKFIGLSDNRFGVSDALALYLLQSMKEFSNYRIMSVTDYKRMEQCTALIGVGDIFNPNELSFSHYAEDFDESMCSLGFLKNYKTKLSTAGLVYAYYGKEILAQHNPEEYPASSSTTKNNHEGDIKHNFRRIYEYFIEVVDCCVWREEMTFPTSEKEKLLEYVTKVGDELEVALCSRKLNFSQVVDIYSGKMGNKFKETLSWFYNSYLASFNMLSKSLEDASAVDPSGQIAFCDHGFTNVTMQDLVERATNSLYRQGKALPTIIILKSKDKYRVECLKYTKLIKKAHFPRVGDEIRRVKDVVYISNDNTYAIMKTAEAAIRMAKALLADIESKAKNSQADRASSSQSTTSTTTNQASTTSPAKSESAANQEDKSQEQSPSTAQSPSTSRMENGEASSSGATPQRISKLLSFRVIHSSRNVSTEKLVEIEKSKPAVVSVELEPANLSLDSILRNLHEKYPDYSHYSICIGDGTELLSNPSTRNPKFWEAVDLEQLCFANPMESSTTDDTYEEVSSSSEENSEINALPPLRSAEFESGEEMGVGVNLDRWTLAELMAAVVLLSTRFGKQMQVASITSPNCIVRFGPNSYAYEDYLHRYTRRNILTMRKLDVLKHDRRLSTCGISFGLYGMDSIESVLESKFPTDRVKQLVYRRLYCRLIEPIDEVVQADSKSRRNGPANGEMGLRTKEAEIFATTIRSCLPQVAEENLTEDEKLAKLIVAVTCARRLYSQLVLSLYEQLAE